MLKLYVLFTSIYRCPTNKNKREIMKADARASRIYLKETHKYVFNNTQSLVNGPAATLPDKSLIYATVRGKLPLHTFLQTNKSDQ